MVNSLGNGEFMTNGNDIGVPCMGLDCTDDEIQRKKELRNLNSEAFENTGETVSFSGTYFLVFLVMVSL